MQYLKESIIEFEKIPWDLISGEDSDFLNIFQETKKHPTKLL